MKTLYAFLAFVVTINLAHAQANLFYQSRQSGDWNGASTWEQSPTGTAGTFTATPIPPTFESNSITIIHQVTIPTGVSVTADQITVTTAAGRLIIASGGQLTLNNGASNDLTINANAIVTVNGIFIRNNLTVVSNGLNFTRLVFGANSSYYHNYTTTFGDLPIATWDPQSTIYLNTFANNSTITANTTWEQEVGNVVYDSPGQRALVDFAGNLKTIRGNFTVLRTGNNALRLSSDQLFNSTIYIEIGSESDATGGDFTIGANGRVIFATTGVNSNIYIRGDFNFTSTSGTGTYLTNTGSTFIHLGGDFNMNTTTGRLHFASAGTTGSATLNMLNGDFTLLSGRIDETGTSPTQGNINFLKNGIQTFNHVGTGVISGLFNYTISGNTTLNLGTSFLAGAGGTTTVESGATVILGSLDPSGALRTGTQGGNIRTSQKIFNSNTTVIYAGAGLQHMGNAQPTGATITTIIDNANGVRLARNISLAGTLRLESGSLGLNNFRLTSSGQLINAGGTLSGTDLSELFITGTGGGDWGNLDFETGADTLEILSLNRTGVDGAATIVGPLKITSQLNLTNGTLINNSSLSMVNGATVTRYNTASLNGNDLTIDEGSYNVTYRTSSPGGGPYANFLTAGELSGGQTDIRNFTVIPAQGGDILQLNKDITVNGNFTLSRGLLMAQDNDITMQGGTWADNAGNLSPGTGTVIFNDTTSAGGTSNPVFGNIRLNAERSLTFTRSFSISGDIDFQPSSSFDMGTFVATFNGPNAQSISANGASFHNITIVKTASVELTLTSPLNLTGLLQFTGDTPNVNYNSNGHLILVSTSDQPGGGQGMIYRLVNGNTVSGSVTVQRYMSGEGRIYRYISSPVANAMVSQWKDDFTITGNFQDPSPTQVICGLSVRSSSPSLFRYNEPTRAYVGYPLPGTATTNSPIVPGVGYSAFIRQCSVATVIDVSGPINQGQMTLPVTFTNVTPEAWNLVGNPYPATIDWDGPGWTKTRMATAMGITDNGSGMVRYYDPGVTDDEIPDGQIAPAQAFWVRSTAANPALIIRETSKVSIVTEFFRDRPPVVQAFSLKLKRGDVYDITYVKTLPEAEATLDDYDAPKIPNATFSFSTISEDNVSMAINALNSLTCGMQLPLRLTNADPGQYTIDLNTKSHFPAYKFILSDKYLNKEVELEAEVYNFTITSDKNSASADRFLLKVEERMPDVALDFSAPSAVCEVGENQVVITASEKDVTYSVWSGENQITETVNGTGSSVAIPLLSDSLHQGDNELIIKARKLCSSVPFSVSFNMEKKIPTIPVITSAVQCNNGPTKLEATTHGGETAYWYEEETDSEPVYVGSVYEVPDAEKQKTYFVAAVSSMTGCSSTRIPVKAERIDFTPAKIESNGLTLVSNHSTGNQWLFNGGPLEDGNNVSVKPTLTGIYELVVTLKGCSTTDRFDYAGGFAIDGLRAYPNPVSNIDNLNIEIIDEEIEKIQITSIVGQVIAEIDVQGNPGKHTVDFRSYADGVYLLVVCKKTDKQSYRLLKK